MNFAHYEYACLNGDIFYKCGGFYKSRCMAKGKQPNTKSVPYSYSVLMGLF